MTLPMLLFVVPVPTADLMKKGLRRHRAHLLHRGTRFQPQT